MSKTQSLSFNDVVLATAAVNNNEDQYDHEDKHKEKMIEEIYSTDNVKVKTELTQRQANVHAKMYVLGDYFKIPLLKDIARETQEHYISLKRGSRKEFTEIANGMNQSIMREDGQQSVVDKLLGK